MTVQRDTSQLYSEFEEELTKTIQEACRMGRIFQQNYCASVLEQHGFMDAADIIRDLPINDEHQV